MKTFKTIFFLAAIIVFFSGTIIHSQEKEELDKLPKPKGGMETLLKNVVYPVDTEGVKIEGKVLVKVIIDVNGDVVKAEIVEGANELLNEAAVKAIEMTKFLPGMKNGEPVQSEVTIPFKFKLK